MNISISINNTRTLLQKLLRREQVRNLRFEIEMLQERLLFGTFFALCSEIKEKIKKTKNENKAEVMAKSQKKRVNLPQGAACTQGPQGWWGWG
ncbi:unnamed protein product [Prunus armeniaca]|uniref:Uncharacterized protein n=1 Tax=Prunus armeniaca TaxID=36596 RepID=A0A6J5WP89_PRUAR|nr:hypothetical protein GBA52_006148 [Prunus armeniaca]CAB4271381.1 unnamed protein product [Prunus armeniaca]CAB4301817.1 unnamed protein product [Prunus armeniaca]